MKENIKKILFFGIKSFFIFLSYFSLIFLMNFIFFLLSDTSTIEFLKLFSIYYDLDTYDAFFIFNALFLVIAPAWIEIYLIRKIKFFYRVILVPVAGILLISIFSIILIGLEDGDMKGFATGVTAMLAIFYQIIFITISFIYEHYKMKLKI